MAKMKIFRKLIKNDLKSSREVGLQKIFRGFSTDFIIFQKFPQKPTETFQK